MYFSLDVWYVLFLISSSGVGFISSPVLSCHTYAVGRGVSDSFLFALLVNLYLFETLNLPFPHWYIRHTRRQGTRVKQWQKKN